MLYENLLHLLFTPDGSPAEASNITPASVASGSGARRLFPRQQQGRPKKRYGPGPLRIRDYPVLKGTWSSAFRNRPVRPASVKSGNRASARLCRLWAIKAGGVALGRLLSVARFIRNRQLAIFDEGSRPEFSFVPKWNETSAESMHGVGGPQFLGRCLLPLDRHGQTIEFLGDHREPAAGFKGDAALVEREAS